MDMAPQHRANDSMPARRPPTGRPRSVGKRCIIKAGGATGNRLTSMSSCKYNMSILMEISSTEEEALQELVHMYQAKSKDDLPLSFDLRQLMDVDEAERRPFLERSLQTCSSDAVPAFIDKYLERTKELNAGIAAAIHSTTASTT